MNKLKKGLLTMGLAAGLAVTGGGVAQLATAENSKAQAVTYGSPYKVQTGGKYCPVFMYYDYNWWEEVFLGKKDGPVLQYYALC